MGETQPAFNRTINAAQWPTGGRPGSLGRDPDDPLVGGHRQPEITSGVDEYRLEETIGGEEPIAVVLSDACRPLRRQLPALAWMVLEQVSLDAVLHEGRLQARTSARQIAQQLAVNPGTAARALKLLQNRRLLVLHRDPGPIGRFGLSVYVLNAVDGLSVKLPDANVSRTAHPSSDQPHVKAPNTVTPSAAPPLVAEPYVVNPHKDGRRSRTRRSPPPPPSVQGGAQAVLDLGLGSA